MRRRFRFALPILAAALAVALPGADAVAAPSCPSNATFTVESGSSVLIGGGCTSTAGPVSYGIVAGPSHGTLTFSSDLTAVTYTPSGTFVGEDGFDYTATDSTGTTTEHVTINVTPADTEGGLPPVCPDSDVFVQAESTVHLVSRCYDPEGAPASVVGFTPPTGGTLTPTGPGEADYKPFEGTTSDSFTYTVSDGHQRTTATVHITVVQSSTGPFATAPEATSTAPLTASLTLPEGVLGDVVVQAAPPPPTSPTGYHVLGTAYNIDAPDGTQDEPLTLTFDLDASQPIDGPLVVFRNGQAITEPCSGAGAYPDPCIASGPETVAGGDTRITIRSSHASLWSFAVGDAYSFHGFYSPVNNLPTVNVANAGRTVPVSFGLEGDRGLGILAAGSPSSQTVGCETGPPTDPVETSTESVGGDLRYDPLTQRYTYNWKTSKAWAGTCRMLSVQLSDDSLHQARFRFR